MSETLITTASNPFVVGEKPAPLVYTFLDSTGSPINLASYTAVFVCREQDGQPATYGAVVSAPALGQVTYTWSGAEYPTAGHYLAEFWTGNGTDRFCSVQLAFDVRLPDGAVPNI